MVCLIEQRYYLYCESLILLQSDHRKCSFKIGPIIFSHTDDHFVWIIFIHLKFAGETPFILHVFLLMLSNKMIVAVSNLQAQFSVLTLMKDLCEIGVNTK